MLLQIVFSFCNYGVLILGLDTYGSDSNLVRHNIYNFDRLVSFSLVMYFPVCVILFIGSSLMSFSRFDISSFGM